MFKIRLEIDNYNLSELLDILEKELGRKLSFTHYPKAEGKPAEIPIESNKPLVPFLEKIYYWAQVKRERGQKIDLKLLTDEGKLDFDTLTFDEFKYQLFKKLKKQN